MRRVVWAFVACICNKSQRRLRVYVYRMNVSCKGLLIGLWRDCLFSFGSIFCTGLALAWAFRQGAWLLAYAILKTTANAVSLSMQVEKARARLRKCRCTTSRRKPFRRTWQLVEYDCWSKKTAKSDTWSILFLSEVRHLVEKKSTKCRTELCSKQDFVS